jgi:hypothetical protein
MTSVTLILLRHNVKYSMIDEEYHSLKQTYCFLCDLIDPKKYPRIPAQDSKECESLSQDTTLFRSDLKEIAETVGYWNPRE